MGKSVLIQVSLDIVPKVHLCEQQSAQENPWPQAHSNWHANWRGQASCPTDQSHLDLAAFLTDNDSMGGSIVSSDSLPKLCVCSRARAFRIVNGFEDQRPVTMVSIGDPGQARLCGPYLPRHVLRMEFYDTAVSSDPFGPREEDVESLLAFAPIVLQSAGICLVHCQAGISRSTAAAVLLHAHWLGIGREVEAAQSVLRLVPYAMPNSLLITYGDAYLGRKGALKRSVEEIFLPPAPVLIPSHGRWPWSAG